MQVHTVDWLRYRRAIHSLYRVDETSEWPPSEALRPPNGNDLVWQDPLTATVFVLDQRHARRLANDFLEQVRARWGTEDGNALFDDLATLEDPDPGLHGIDLTDDVWAAPGLPAYARRFDPSSQAPLPAPARVTDLAWLTCGILWALDHEQFVNDWLSVQAWCFFDAFSHYTDQVNPSTWQPANESASESLFLARTAARLACGVEISPEELQRFEASATQRQIGVVRGQTIRVKDYFLRNNKIPAMRGASHLIEAIAAEHFPHLFIMDSDLCRQGLIYAGGAGCLAVVPPETVEKIAGAWEQLHERQTLVARCAAAYDTVTLYDLTRRFPSVQYSLELGLQRRRGTKLHWWFSPDLDWVSSSLAERIRHWERSPRNQVCDHCGLHRAQRITPSAESAPVCDACAIKWAVGSGTVGAVGKTYFWERYARWVEEEDDRLPDRLGELAERHGDGRTIAVIYGDANDMGGTVQRIPQPGHFRYFSTSVRRAAHRAVFAALRNRLGTSAVEFIAMGGDDLTLIMPGDAALATAAEITGRFECWFFNASTRTPTLTLSVGVAIAYVKTPITYIFDHAQQLLKSAKHKARRLKQVNVPSGTVHVARVDTPSITKLASTQYNVRWTIRPFSWRQALAFVQVAARLQPQKASVGRALLYALREALLDSSPEEATLYYRYQLARHAGDQSVDEWKVLAQALTDLMGREPAEEGTVLPGPFWRDADGAAVTPWIDLIELAAYSEARSARPPASEGGR